MKLPFLSFVTVLACYWPSVELTILFQFSTTWKKADIRFPQKADYTMCKLDEWTLKIKQSNPKEWRGTEAQLWLWHWAKNWLLRFAFNLGFWQSKEPNAISTIFLAMLKLCAINDYLSTQVIYLPDHCRSMSNTNRDVLWVYCHYIKIPSPRKVGIVDET